MTLRLRSYRCVACRQTWVPDAVRWRCDCGGSLVLTGLDEGGEAPAPVSLGEGRTPVVDIRGAGRPLRAKLELCNPTLSFKDRGAAVLVGLAVAVGAERLVVDSSGNAGTAIAAYGARAGLPVEVFVPATTSAPKLAQATAHGATVVRVDGDRTATAGAAAARVSAGDAFYASHARNPWFWEGVAGMVTELAADDGSLPDTLLLPVGNGTLVLGAAVAFERLGATCRIVAVVGPGSKVAEGIAVPDPPRGAEVQAIVASTGGRVVTVTDDEVVAARADLARQGLWVEPTAAAPVAAARHLTDGDGDVVVPLCGAGLKAP